MNVLIIEPSKSINAIISSVLSPLHVNIKTSSGIKRAKTLINSAFKIDLVIMGSVLEDGKADELIDYIRQSDAARHAPIYLLTSNEDEGNYKHALGKGVTEIFQKSKPLEFAETLAKKIQDTENSRKIAGHILYVEDNEIESLMVEDYLTDQGFSISVFKSAEEAYIEFKKKPFDLILCDMFLKGKMTGLSLLRKIRNITGEKNRVPTVVISGDQDTTRKIELLSAGANDFIAKPVLQEELLARVSNLVVTKQLQDQVQAQQKELESLAMTDQLTGLFNRNYLFNNIPKKISEANRHDWDCCLIVADVDKFKSVNDTYGHAVGDIILKEVGKALLQSCRNEDIVARFGGEEFVIMLSHCNYDQGLIKAEKIRKAIEDLRPNDLNITSSFGLTSILSTSNVTPTFDTLFKIADKAVYKAKDDGRNRVVGSKDLA